VALGYLEEEPSLGAAMIRFNGLVMSLLSLVCDVRAKL